MKSPSIHRCYPVIAMLMLATCCFGVANADDNELAQTEAKVRESFQEQMKIQEARIEKAEADLKRIKEEFENRMANAEQIIKQHAEQLALRKQTTKADEADVSAAVLSAEGWKAWQKQDWREALSKFELAVKKDPHAANTVNGLGWTYLHLRQYDKAISTFEKALKIDPTHGGALNGIGQCLMAQGQMDKAESMLIEATEAVITRMGESATVKSGSTASWTSLVIVLVRKGDNDAAIQWADRFLKHKPDDPVMQGLLGEARQAKEADKGK